MSRRSRVINARLRERVVVTLKGDQSFSGILYSHDDRALVLRHAEALGVRSGEEPNVPLDGELIILLADVAWIQKP